MGHRTFPGAKPHIEDCPRQNSDRNPSVFFARVTVLFDAAGRRVANIDQLGVRTSVGYGENKGVRLSFIGKCDSPCVPRPQ
jgi:hypothetical protein